MNLIRSFCFVITILVLAMVQPVVGMAQSKPELTIYTYDAFAADWGPGPMVIEAFERQCECKLNIVSAGSSINALRKAQLEGANTKADIILGLDTNIAEDARTTGLFAPHQVSAANVNIPHTEYQNWKDPLFLPFDYSHFAFVYDSSKLKSPPNSFDALLKMPDEVKILIQDPRSSTPGLGLLLWVKQRYGDEAKIVWAKLAPKIVTVAKSWSDAYGLFLKGEADLVLSYTTSPAYHINVEDKSQYKAAMFADGHYMQIELAGILKTTKHMDLARKFMAFMISDTFQAIIPTTNWTIPVIKTEKPLPKGFPNPVDVGVSLLMDPKTVEASRKDWIKEWQAAIAQ